MRLAYTAKEDSVSEIVEVTHPETNPFQNFGLVIAALQHYPLRFPLLIRA